MVALNHEIIVLDEGNRPNYLAYLLLAARAETLSYSKLNFAEIRRLPTSQVERLAFFTDGFEPELLPDVWGMSRHPRALQRQFNIWSRQKHFADDATCVLIEK
jgi:hypothetical protein